jgi:hypothetical protein
MKNEAKMVTVYFLFFVFFYTCSDNNNKNVNTTAEKTNSKNMKIQKINYDSVILLIEKKVVDLTSPDDLFRIPEFKEVYENSSFYINDATKFLFEQKFTTQQKFIVIFSMQRLTLKEYTDFLTVCKSLYIKGSISEDILATAVSPDFGKKRVVIENYNNPNIKKILLDIKSQDSISIEFKKMIEKILSGEYWKNIKKSIQND